MKSGSLPVFATPAMVAAMEAAACAALGLVGIKPLWARQFA
jgi:predicted thioesterase